ncbi:MAG TPA: SDR family NAD(P)-dependent oxidoreductase [Acidimicrobiales bacterium]|nr:SDR family NAD(P)-dependent oxidoreductase [Acidimicrobiales bacterium]
MDLQGKRVLVTGASRGIGREIAIACAQAGARVALVARNEQAIKELAAELGGTAHPCDLADPEQVRDLIARVESDGGPIDVLVNNAGLDAVGGLEQSSAAEVAELLHVNLLAPIELTRQVLPGMVTRKAGHIVNVSSFAAAAMFPGGTAYAASKAGLSNFTEVLRWELNGTGVDLTIVELGPIPTDMLSHVKDYRPTEAGFKRLYLLRLIVDIPASTVAAHVVSAITSRKRSVRLPRRGVLFPMLRASSQRIIRAICVGIPNR